MTVAFTNYSGLTDSGVSVLLACVLQHYNEKLGESKGCIFEFNTFGVVIIFLPKKNDNPNQDRRFIALDRDYADSILGKESE